MKRRLLLVLCTAGLALAVGQASMAKETVVNCRQVRRALRSGKTKEQVAKDLKVSLDTVKGCTLRHVK